MTTAPAIRNTLAHPDSDWVTTLCRCPTGGLHPARHEMRPSMPARKRWPYLNTKNKKKV
jgi:hypothetical protein